MMSTTERTILVIDRHPPTLAALLRQHGWRVRTATHGLDGLAMIAASPPDLALVDLDLEDLDGLSVLARLRDAGPAAPPCLMTSTGHAARCP
jgi:DNA-binding response OmpR family regulator